MIPSFPKRMTGPIPAGGGTGIFLRFTAQAPAGERIQFVSLRLRGNFLFSSLADYCIMKHGTGRAVVPALFRVDNLWGCKGGASCANGPFLSVGAADFGGPRRSPARLPPFRGKLSAARLTDEGADGGNGRSFPPPPHPSFAPQMPPSPQGEGTARQGCRALRKILVRCCP